MRTLDELRVEIDRIDQQMVQLFEEADAGGGRGDGAQKGRRNPRIPDSSREEAVVAKNTARLHRPRNWQAITSG